MLYRLSAYRSPSATAAHAQVIAERPALPAARLAELLALASSVEPPTACIELGAGGRSAAPPDGRVKELEAELEAAHERITELVRWNTELNDMLDAKGPSGSSPSSAHGSASQREVKAREEAAAREAAEREAAAELVAAREAAEMEALMQRKSRVMRR